MADDKVDYSAFSIFERAQRSRGAPVPPSGGGGTSGEMEARVAKLEADVGHLLREVTDIRASTRTLATDLTTVRVDIAGMKSDLSHKPGRGFIFTVAAGMIAFLTAVMVLQDRIQHFFGVAHP